MTEINPKFDFSGSILIDFGNIFFAEKGRFKDYFDLSFSGDFQEAINNIYDTLRWAETREDAKMVLITNFQSLLHSHKELKTKNTEHQDALFDRIFRAATGREFKV